MVGKWHLICFVWFGLVWFGFEVAFQGAWVAQLVKHPTLDFGLGHDLIVVRWSTPLGSVLGMEPA